MEFPEGALIRRRGDVLQQASTVEFEESSKFSLTQFVGGGIINRQTVVWRLRFE